MRLAFVTLFLALTACSSNEAKLEAAVQGLQTQLSDRQRLLADSEELKLFNAQLDEWRMGSGRANELPLVPQPRVPLAPYKLTPLAAPDLPPVAALESGRSKELRAEATALIAQIREADNELSQQELRKKDLADRLASALEVDRQRRQVKEAHVESTEPFPYIAPFWDAGTIAIPPKGKMRRVE